MKKVWADTAHEYHCAIFWWVSVAQFGVEAFFVIDFIIDIFWLASKKRVQEADFRKAQGDIYPRS